MAGVIFAPSSHQSWIRSLHAALAGNLFFSSSRQKSWFIHWQHFTCIQCCQQHSNIGVFLSMQLYLPIGTFFLSVLTQEPQTTVIHNPADGNKVFRKNQLHLAFWLAYLINKNIWQVSSIVQRRSSINMNTSHMYLTETCLMNTSHTQVFLCPLSTYI